MAGRLARPAGPRTHAPLPAQRGAERAPLVAGRDERPVRGRRAGVPRRARPYGPGGTEGGRPALLAEGAAPARRIRRAARRRLAGRSATLRVPAAAARALGGP